MPVKKFRNVEELNQPRWRKPNDPELLRTIRYLWELGSRTRKRRFPAGVYKHRGIEEAQALRAVWEAQNVKLSPGT